MKKGGKILKRVKQKEKNNLGENSASGVGCAGEKQFNPRLSMTIFTGKPFE